MNDLIWIGNTLYPRWFVLAVLALIMLVLVGGFTWLASNGDR